MQTPVEVGWSSYSRSKEPCTVVPTEPLQLYIILSPQHSYDQIPPQTDTFLGTVALLLKGNPLASATKTDAL